MGAIAKKRPGDAEDSCSNPLRSPVRAARSADSPAQEHPTNHQTSPGLVARIALIAALALCALLIAAPGAKAATTSAPEIWFAPFPAGTPGAPSQEGTGQTDFDKLFSSQSSWTATASKIKVFQLYPNWVLTTTDARLNAVIKFVKAKGMAIAIEAPALTWTSPAARGSRATPSTRWTSRSGRWTA